MIIFTFVQVGHLEIAVTEITYQPSFALQNPEKKEARIEMKQGMKTTVIPKS